MLSTVFIGAFSLAVGRKYQTAHFKSVSVVFEADPCSVTHLQVCWADSQQRSTGLGVTGAEGVLHCPTNHQHREERHGVHVAPRPQTSPCPGVETPPSPTFLSKGKGEQRFIKDFIYFIFPVKDNSGSTCKCMALLSTIQQPKS